MSDDIQKLWEAVNYAKRENAVIAEKLEGFEKYQRERNHDILNSLNGVNGQLLMLRDQMADIKTYEEKRDGNLFKHGVFALGSVVVGLIAYIWAAMVGK